VIDSGREKRASFDFESRCQELELTTISRSSSEQRAGRTGRTTEKAKIPNYVLFYSFFFNQGFYYALFSQIQLEDMPEYPPPSIQHEPVDGLLLKLLYLEIDIKDLDMIDKPSDVAIKNGLENLYFLGAIDSVEDRNITELGKRMANIPTPPQMARALLRSVELGCSSEVSILAGFMQISDVFYGRDRDTTKLNRAGFSHEKRGDFYSFIQLYTVSFFLLFTQI